MTETMSIDTDRAGFLYIIGYVCPNGIFGREILRSTCRIETRSDVDEVQIAVRHIACEPDAFVLSVSLLSAPDRSAQ